MLIVLSLLFYLTAVFLFSFSLWRKLRDDYTNEQIFSWTLRVLATGLLGVWVAKTFLPQFTFFILLIFCSVSGLIFLKTLSFKFFELIDALAISIFYFVLFSWIGLGFSEGRNLFTINIYTTQQFYPHVFISFFSIYIYLIFKKYYRQFSWYPSGKVGFCGLASLAVFFLLNGGIEVVTHLNNPDILYKIYSYSLSSQLINAIIGSGLFITLSIVIYLRSGLKR